MHYAQGAHSFLDDGKSGNASFWMRASEREQPVSDIYIKFLACLTRILASSMVQLYALIDLGANYHSATVKTLPPLPFAYSKLDAIMSS